MKKFHPTYLVWLWLLNYPKKTDDEKEIIEDNVANEPLSKRLIAFFLWLIITLTLFFLLSYTDYDLENIIILDIIIILGTIFITFSFSAIIWSFIMRKTNFIHDHTIEKILRDGVPIMNKRIK
ncbi:MAG: hypothetical protein GY699_22900 [Desulfobacteraceae bacterium]|nr:hypothetical protein [Desulfobacteraceae bacterium]